MRRIFPVLAIFLAAVALSACKAVPKEYPAPESTPLSTMENSEMEKSAEFSATEESAKDQPTEKTPNREPKEIASAGVYANYRADLVSTVSGNKTVLFFHAAWCPLCRASDADITAHLPAIPQQVTILKVDYDTETALKEKYGVNYQHTFVVLNDKGEVVDQWNGSQTLQDI